MQMKPMASTSDASDCGADGEPDRKRFRIGISVSSKSASGSASPSDEDGVESMWSLLKWSPPSTGEVESSSTQRPGTDASTSPMEDDYRPDPSQVPTVAAVSVASSSPQWSVGAPAPLPVVPVATAMAWPLPPAYPMSYLAPPPSVPPPLPVEPACSPGRVLAAQPVGRRPTFVSAPAAAASPVLAPIVPPPRPKLGGDSGRNVIDRQAWSAEEDAAILRSVQVHGLKWRLVAADLPGRSDDAVRNRWKRIREPKWELQMRDDGTSHYTYAKQPSHRKQRDSADDAKDERRCSWSRKEDDTILHSVSEFGHRWNQIADRLPGRSEHAIRNRYARLQNLVRRGKSIAVSESKELPIGISLVPNTNVQA